MKTIIHSVILALVVGSGWCSPEPPSSLWVVVPNHLENSNGNVGITGSPFTPYRSVTGEYEPRRRQQVYAASEFISTMPEGGWISGVGFRQWSGAYIGSLPDIQINLSTTAKVPDGLSITYSENVGMDDTIVFGRGRLDWVPFTQFVEFTTPFFYDPRMGNLLMDAKSYAGVPLPFPIENQAFLEGEFSIGDSISAVGGPLSSTTGSVGSAGLVSVFVVTPVPEPNTWALLALGALALGYTGWRRKRSQHAQNRAQKT